MIDEGREVGLTPATRELLKKRVERPVGRAFGPTVIDDPRQRFFAEIIRTYMY